MICRRPRPELRAFVDLVWSVDARDATSAAGQELSLPGGSHHVVIRMAAPLRIFRSSEDQAGEEFGNAILGGMRLNPVRKAVDSGGSVGAILRPDALGLVRKLAPPDLAGRYTLLTDIWTTSEAADRIAQIRGTPSAAKRLERFERMLLRFFQEAGAPDPVVRHSMGRLDGGARIGELVAETGLSHRHFCARFHDNVGLVPVDYRQVRRFDRLIDSLARPERCGLAEVALIAGYSDQPHMAREFRAFSGLSLREFHRLSPTGSRHVALPA